MTEQLIAAYGLPDPVDSSYWLKLVPEKKEDDRATIDDAANLLDTLYDRNPCIDEQTGGEEPPTDEEGSLEPPTDEDGFWEIVRGEVDFAACAEENCDLLKLRVYRSHLAEPYKLVYDNGEQRRLITMSESARQMITVAGERYGDLEYPVAGNLKYRWSSVRDGSGGSLAKPPSVEADGARLVFSRAVTGILIAEYDTAYDLVTVAVPRNEDGTPGTCHVLAYYAGTITEADLQAPPIDEDMDSVAVRLACSGTEKIDMPDKPYSCYERVYHRVLCRCSGKDSGGSFYTEPDVACPEHWDPEHVSAGRHLLGSRSVIRDYVPCPGEENTDGPEEHRKVCCVSGTPPLCDTRYKLYSGGKGFDLEAARKEYGAGVVLVPVGPKDGSCGKWTIRYKRPNKNCCDEIEDLRAHPDNPVEIGNNGRRRMRVLDGQVPIRWRVSGGLYFDNGLDEIVTDIREVYVNAPEVFCPDAKLVADDECTKVTMPLQNSSGGGEALSLTLERDYLAGDGGILTLWLEGGIPPFILYSGGEHTYFQATGTREIELGGGGFVNLVVEPEQICLGGFDVTVSDACTDIDTVHIDEEDIPGIACRRYDNGGVSCLAGWVDNGPLPGDGRWFTYTGFGSFITRHCNAVLPHGKYWIHGSSRIYFAIIKAPADDAPDWAKSAIVEYSLNEDGATYLDSYCGEETCI